MRTKGVGGKYEMWKREMRNIEIIPMDKGWMAGAVSQSGSIGN